MASGRRARTGGARGLYNRRVAGLGNCPMKIIFSRKGFDSAAGKCPSPVVDGQLFSFPIPATNLLTPTVFGNLRPPIPELIDHLTAGRIAHSDRCHLDPDIDPDALAKRPQDWRGALGQAGAALSHLRNQGVGPGDLFLFWGLFQAVERRNGRWKFVGKSFHQIFGWLQVENVCDAGKNGSSALRDFPWLKDHPHARDGWIERNAIYIAYKNLVLNGVKAPGSGVLKRGYRLTAENGGPKSYWRVPSWLDITLGGTGMTFHPAPRRWKGDGILETAGRGQEFVADIADNQEAIEWAAQLIDERK